MDTQSPQLLDNGEPRCPKCRRKRPMEDLIGDYDAASEFFVVRGIRCSACQRTTGEGKFQWGSQFPTRNGIPKEIHEPICPFCKRVVIPVPGRDAEYVKCPGSSLIYRLVISG